MSQTQEESQEITAAWLRWGTHQDCFLARPWGEPMGWKTWRRLVPPDRFSA